jgi:hypothetical protein
VSLLLEITEATSHPWSSRRLWQKRLKFSLLEIAPEHSLMEVAMESITDATLSSEATVVAFIQLTRESAFVSISCIPRSKLCVLYVYTLALQGPQHPANLIPWPRRPSAEPELLPTPAAVHISQVSLSLTIWGFWHQSFLSVHSRNCSCSERGRIFSDFYRGRCSKRV